VANVLLVDHNPETQRSVAGLLRYRTRHDVTAVASSSEAVRVATGGGADLVLANVLMCVTQDYALLHSLRGDPRTASLPILVHTSGELDELTRRRLDTHHVAGILALPVSADELSGQIEAGLQKGAPSNTVGIRKAVWERIPMPEPEPERHIRPVNWAVDGAKPEKARTAPDSQAAPAPAARPRKKSGQPRPPGGEKPEFRQFEPGQREASSPDGKEPGPFREVTWPKDDKGGGSGSSGPGKRT